MRASRPSAEPSEAAAPGSSAAAQSFSYSRRNPPLLPTPLEAAVLAAFPMILAFGSLFALISPETRTAPYDPITQAHIQDASAPSYFAQKSNVFNQVFVKRGWGWTTFAFVFFILTHPAHGRRFSLTPTPRRVQALVRWTLVTGWWVLVTQWCFGPPIIDRGFRWTGGKCDMAESRVRAGGGNAKEVFTAVACKAAGGRWSGGHDISGHVFLLVLSSGFLLQEVGWVALRWAAWRPEERSVIMADGAVKSASVESATGLGDGKGTDALGIGGKVAIAVVALSGWMLLMTAIYFHTWFEKLTGLLCSLVALYGVYILPRFVPKIRQVVGLPGI